MLQSYFHTFDVYTFHVYSSFFTALKTSSIQNKADVLYIKVTYVNYGMYTTFSLFRDKKRKVAGSSVTGSKENRVTQS